MELLDIRGLKCYYYEGDNVETLTQTEKMISFLETIYPIFLNHEIDGIDAINASLIFLLDSDHSLEDSKEIETIEKAKEKLDGLNLDVKEIRRAFQLYILKAFKDSQVANALITPDSIGYFMSYLIKKCYPVPPKSVCDPFLGSGNLLATISEELPNDTLYTGIEIHDRLAELARNYLDALDINHTIYHQDSFLFKDQMFDFIISDLPIYKKDSKAPYLPYYAILHHLNFLQNNQYMMVLIENDFFDYSQSETFKKELAEVGHMFGLIKLPESLFKTHPKSILILKKKEKKDDILDRFLVAELPSFIDKDAFEDAIDKINDWFEKGRTK